MGAAIILGFFALLGFLIAGYSWGSWAIWRVGFVGFGAFVMISSGYIAFQLPRYIALQWRDDRAYRQDRRIATLDAYESNQGVTTTETVSETTITTDDPLKMILLALAMDQQISAGNPQPFSVRNLAGKPQYLRVNRKLFGTELLRIGEVHSKEQAQAIGDWLAERRLIENRRPGAAGNWTAHNPANVVEMLLEG
jgi:hypothetical protein